MSTQSITADVKKHLTWSIVTGVITALLGLFLIAFPLITATLTALLLGSVLIVVGVAQFVFALHSQSLGRFILKVILSVLYFGAGVAMVFFPLIGVAALTVLLGAVLLVYAGVAIFAAFELRPLSGWGWYLVDGLASLAMGILILFGWPSSLLWAIGTLVGVAVLMGGISRIMIAVGIRSSIGSIGRDFPKAA
jgi:uncharacterized membrane protein HdeD (DUF308 family)